MKTILILIILINAGFIANAQEIERLYFEPEFHSKLSLGESTRKIILYAPGFTINVPAHSKYFNPLYGVGFTINYNINAKFSAGIGSGIDIAKFEKLH